jgi:hypothetical protein
MSHDVSKTRPTPVPFFRWFRRKVVARLRAKNCRRLQNAPFRERLQLQYFFGGVLALRSMAKRPDFRVLQNDNVAEFPLKSAQCGREEATSRAREDATCANQALCDAHPKMAAKT